ncbi:MAG: amidohydrolase [Gemmatimonadota bacterium]
MVGGPGTTPRELRVAVRMAGALAGAAGAVALAAAPLAGQEPADLIFTNAVIHTADPAAPLAEAMAISESAMGDIIVAIGSAEEVEWYRGPETNVIDLQGHAVIPGLIDAHAHVMNLGKFLRTVDLVGTGSVEEIAARVRQAAADRPAGEWILGRGWDQNDWAVKEFPTAAMLDSAAPDHPVWLTRVDGHAEWANTRALEAAGVTAATEDPEGGRIMRDEAGNPTGVFIDDAEDLVEAVIPEPGPEELAARLAAAQERMVSVGLTGVHDMGTDREEWDLYRAWAAEGRLLPRIVVYLDGDDLALMESALDSRSKIGKFVRVRGIKFYADGALGSRGAALLEPYSDDPGNVGLLLTRPDTLRVLVERALRLGLQPAIHAIGDRGNRVALDAIALAEESVASDLGQDVSAGSTAGHADWIGIAPRIEHAQVVALDDIPRFSELDVIASMQPTHATSDMYWAEDRLGPDRIQGAYAWRKMLDAGVPLACGSDFPVENVNPFYGLYAAVTRQDREGWPEGGWRPEERLTREEALACFTRWAAEAAGMGDEVGILAVGRLADFLVLDRDIMEVPAEEIWRTQVLRTVIGGETVYEASPAGE